MQPYTLNNYQILGLSSVSHCQATQANKSPCMFNSSVPVRQPVVSFGLCGWWLGFITWESLNGITQGQLSLLPAWSCSS